MSKSFRRAIRRLRNGVPIYIKRSGPHQRGTFRVQYDGHGYRGIVIIHTDMGTSYVEAIWDTPTLDWLRRIAVGYFPAVAKAIGPARQFAGV